MKKTAATKTVKKTPAKAAKTQQAAKPAQALALHKCRNGHIVEMVPESLRVIIKTELNGHPHMAYVTETLCPLCLVHALNQIAATGLYSGPSAPAAEPTTEKEEA